MSISESSLRPGGDLFNALVGNSKKNCSCVMSDELYCDRMEIKYLLGTYY